VSNGTNAVINDSIDGVAKVNNPLCKGTLELEVEVGICELDEVELGTKAEDEEPLLIIFKEVVEVEVEESVKEESEPRELEVELGGVEFEEAISLLLRTEEPELIGASLELEG